MRFRPQGRRIRSIREIGVLARVLERDVLLRRRRHVGAIHVERDITQRGPTGESVAEWCRRNTRAMRVSCEYLSEGETASAMAPGHADPRGRCAAPPTVA